MNENDITKLASTIMEIVKKDFVLIVDIGDTKEGLVISSFNDKGYLIDVLEETANELKEAQNTNFSNN